MSAKWSRTRCAHRVAERARQRRARRGRASASLAVSMLSSISRLGGGGPTLTCGLEDLLPTFALGLSVARRASDLSLAASLILELELEQSLSLNTLRRRAPATPKPLAVRWPDEKPWPQSEATTGNHPVHQPPTPVGRHCVGPHVTRYSKQRTSYFTCLEGCAIG